MVKSHNIRLIIENHSGFAMNYVNDWYDSGRLADTYSWPAKVQSGGRLDVLNYERDHAVAGCSGYANYEINGEVITFAFSNPSMGKNKLGVGIGGKIVWDEMGYNGYKQFTLEIPVRSTILKFVCKCTGSTTNHATVSILCP